MRECIIQLYSCMYLCLHISLENEFCFNMSCVVGVENASSSLYFFPCCSHSCQPSLYHSPLQVTQSVYTYKWKKCNWKKGCTIRWKYMNCWILNYFHYSIQISNYLKCIRCSSLNANVFWWDECPDSDSSQNCCTWRVG